MPMVVVRKVKPGSDLLLLYLEISSRNRGRRISGRTGSHEGSG